MELSLERFIWLYGNSLAEYGLDQEKLTNHYNQWKEGKEDGSVNAFGMYVFQTILEQLKSAVLTDYLRYKYLQDIHMNMATFERHAYDKKGNANWRKGNLYKLWQIKNEDAPFLLYIKVIANCCPECDKNADLSLSIDKAISSHPIGSAKCTRSAGCVCLYLSLPARDTNDRLIKK